MIIDVHCHLWDQSLMGQNAPEEAKKANVFRPNGCSTCNNTGYKGRTGLFEVMEIKGEIKDLILTKLWV